MILDLWRYSDRKSKITPGEGGDHAGDKAAITPAQM